MRDFQIVGVGVHGKAGVGFQIHRRRGSGDFLFLQFHVPVKVRLREREFQGGAGACILYTPGVRQWYWGVDAHGAHGVLDNSWVHFLGPDALRALRRYRLPLNALFYPREPESSVEHLRAIQREVLQRGDFWEDQASVRLRLLLVDAARNTLPRAPGGRALRRMETLASFRRIRQRVHEQLDRRWTIAELARLARLSPSRFAALYKECFGVAPIDDLLDARIAHARELLTNSTLPVKQVAAMSGFENIYYFSRAFRRRVGCPPSKYYERNVAR